MSSFFGIALLAAALTAPVVYVFGYAWLRFFGTLCVNEAGFHAGNVELFGWVAAPAVRLFGVYQPLMRRESSLRRRWRGRVRTRREQPVSDVVVEIIPLA